MCVSAGGKGGAQLLLLLGGFSIFNGTIDLCSNRRSDSSDCLTTIFGTKDAVIDVEKFATFSPCFSLVFIFFFVLNHYILFDVQMIFNQQVHLMLHIVIVAAYK